MQVGTYSLNPTASIVCKIKVPSFISSFLLVVYNTKISTFFIDDKQDLDNIKMSRIIQNNSVYEELRKFQLEWGKIVTNTEMTYMLKLLDKNF